MTQEKKTGWGGSRPNAGRKKSDKVHRVTIRMNNDAYGVYQRMTSRHDTIQQLILHWGQENK